MESVVGATGVRGTKQKVLQARTKGFQVAPWPINTQRDKGTGVRGLGVDTSERGQRWGWGMAIGRWATRGFDAGAGSSEQ